MPAVGRSCALCREQLTVVHGDAGTSCNQLSLAGLRTIPFGKQEFRGDRLCILSRRMESTMAQTASRPTHTFALAKSMAPRESTGNISSIGWFLGPQPNFTRRSLHLNLTYATEVPAKLLDVHRLHCTEKTRQTRGPFGIAETQKCKRGGFLCRAEAPIHAEKVPSRASPFETIPDLVAYIGQGPLLSKLREDEKSVAKVRSTIAGSGQSACSNARSGLCYFDDYPV